MKKCLKCNKTFKDEEKFCNQCGEKLVDINNDKKRFCPNCGSLLNENGECENCLKNTANLKENSLKNTEKAKKSQNNFRVYFTNIFYIIIAIFTIVLPFINWTYIETSSVNSEVSFLGLLNLFSQIKEVNFSDGLLICTFVVFILLILNGIFMLVRAVKNLFKGKYIHRFDFKIFVYFFLITVISGVIGIFIAETFFLLFLGTLFIIAQYLMYLLIDSKNISMPRKIINFVSSFLILISYFVFIYTPIDRGVNNEFFYDFPHGIGQLFANGNIGNYGSVLFIFYVLSLLGIFLSLIYAFLIHDSKITGILNIATSIAILILIILLTTLNISYKINSFYGYCVPLVFTLISGVLLLVLNLFEKKPIENKA